MSCLKPTPEGLDLVRGEGGCSQLSCRARVLCAAPTARLASAPHNGYSSKEQQPAKGNKDISEATGC